METLSRMAPLAPQAAASPRPHTQHRATHSPSPSLSPSLSLSTPHSTTALLSAPSAPTSGSRGASATVTAVCRTGALPSATWQGATWQAQPGVAGQGVRSEGAPRRRVAAGAKRKGGNGAATVAEGEELDQDLRTGLNEMANEGIRVMLGEDIQQLMEFKDKVDSVGEYLVSEGHMEAARFMLVLKAMLDHELVEEAKLLEGPYKRAFEKVGSVIEDSGWLLAPPESEAGNVEMVDEELIPPVLRNPY